MTLENDALTYHRTGRPGKLEVVATKPFLTQRDLSLAYTPGVAEPCRRIVADPQEVFDYTAKGNLVAVITNGTAVLGLGNIGPLAGKPVMEGKAVLFKRFADIDVFDLEIAATDPDEFVRTVQLLEPTFGGINLEDVRAPECFRVEQELARTLSIPVFHDDQHGTAIITSAGLLNALELVDKEIEKVKVVVVGAGAAGIACARLFISLGLKQEHLILVDSKGVVYRGREVDMNPYKESLAADTKARTLADALVGADVLVGVSAPNLVTPQMLARMAPKPIIFACANPDPEIPYPDAKKARPDAIVATGRSDFPNQVNNVLGFPFVFRGALDVRATAINEAMKKAAVRALADLAKQDVPDIVAKAYGVESFRFGPEYILPKPFDPRVLLWEAPAVAQAAMESGVARKKIDLEVYRNALEARLGKSRELMRIVANKAKRAPKRVVFPEGTHPKILRASHHLVDEGIARPILLGDRAQIEAGANDLGLPLVGIEIIDPHQCPQLDSYVEELFSLRQRKGLTRAEARQLLVKNPNYFGAMMVHTGDADALISGITQHYPDTIRPALQVIGMRPDVNRVAGLYMIITKSQAVGQRILLFADTTVNIQPTAEDLAEIALLTAEIARRFDLVPKVAFLSYSNFGSVRNPQVLALQEAVRLVKKRAPDLIVDGEMQVDSAVDPEVSAEHFPFSAIQGDANVLIFPELFSGNIAYKMMQRLGGAEVIGPILMGMRKPVHVLQQASDVNDITNITALAVVDAQSISTRIGKASAP